MTISDRRMTLIAAVAAIMPVSAFAETPRELLTVAAFQTSDKAKALVLIGQAITASDRILASRPGDHEAMLQRGVAIGYRAKLTRSRADAKASLATFEALAARDPKDAEAQMVIAGWHLDAIDQLGSFVARAALGARTDAGQAGLNRAVVLGGARSFYPGLAAMMQIRLNNKDVVLARKWAETAAVAPTPTPLDILVKRSVVAMLPALRAGNGKDAAAIARKRLPFGGLSN